MKNLRKTAAMSVVFMAATPVLADELLMPMPQDTHSPFKFAMASQPSTGWNGFYTGGQIGMITAKSQEETSDGLASLKIEGSSMGLHVGYMQEAGRFVLGAELDHDALQFDELTISLGPNTSTENIDVNGHVTRIKARVGYNVGRYMPYVTAGVAHLEADAEDTNGTFIGVGIAFKTTERLVVGGELIQHRFNDTFGNGQDTDATTLSLRASFRF